jgi:hypothetical protein
MDKIVVYVSFRDYPRLALKTTIALQGLYLGATPPREVPF